MEPAVAASAVPADRAMLRRLATHEASLQALGDRALHDLGDGLMLLDPADPEPYWNRLVAPDWPADRRAFDRRLDLAITLFASHDRLPHVWPFPSLNQPPDLVERLLDAGFETMGSDILMVLADPTPAVAWLAQSLPRGVTVEQVNGRTAGTVPGAADAAAVLVDAFDVGPDRLASIELETRVALEGSSLHMSILRLDGWAVAVAKRSTVDNASYLSSIGTRPEVRRRGLGSLVTAIAVRDAVAAGSEVTYLKVDSGNDAAQRLYRRLGFVAVAGRIPDLLLRR